MRGLIQEMGGSPQYLQRPHTAIQSGAVGAGGEAQAATGVGEGAPPPLGRRGAPEEQVRAIMARIVNAPPGEGLPGGQTPAPRQQARHTRGDRGRGDRGRIVGGIGGGERGVTGRQGHRPPAPLQKEGTNAGVPRGHKEWGGDGG